MNHFEGLTPEQRWRNELLGEIRENNRLLRQILESGSNSEVVNEIKQKRQYNRHNKGDVNQ